MLTFNVTVTYFDIIEQKEKTYELLNVERKKFMTFRDTVFRIGLLIDVNVSKMKLFRVIPPQYIRDMIVEIKGIEK